MSSTPDFPLGSMSGLLSRHWWVVLLFGLLAVAFGVQALLAPIGTAAVLTFWLGIVAIVEGIVALAAAIAGSAPVSRGWAVFYAVVSIVFGVLAAFDPIGVAGTLLLFLAIWLVVAGIYRIVFAIRVRKHIRGEWLLILSGALAVLLGVLFAINPLSGIVITTLWIGAMALVYGVLQIVAAFRLRALDKA